ncbi:MAG: acetyl-CoA carboxylase biotin carboxyl carrier protein [Oscillospiraceae bacterium]
MEQNKNRAHAALENKIRGYAGLMRELELTGMEITENGVTVRLERNVSQIAVPAAVQHQPAQTAETQHEAPSKGGEFSSPMVGVFYCAPAENAKPFVKVGDTVHKGDVLCIIEAMKLMNEITSDRDGVIEEICVSNGQVVDYGHVLFRIREA